MRPPAPDAPQPGTRDRLLDKAERLFAERGFDGTSVREITTAAQVNLGAINYHFRSKESLYAAVFARRVALIRDPIVAAARGSANLARRDPGQALHAVGRAFLAPHRDRGTTRRLLALFTREQIETCLPAGLLVRELMTPVIQATTDLMLRVRPDLPEVTARACAHSFFAQVMHIVKGASSDTTPVDQKLAHAVRFTVAAVQHIEVPSRKKARGGRPPRRRRPSGE
jgi:AcrR family transcriptional regulator